MSKKEHSNKNVGAINIIAGKWRGKKMPVLDVKGLRPTPNRVRETLFNWLQFELADYRCLDVFAGSGILGFEALSRGALAVTMLERDPKLVNQLYSVQQQLRITTNLNIINCDSIQWLQQNNLNNYDLLFLDAPYAETLLPQALALITAKDFAGMLYIESNQPLLSILPTNWELAKYSRAGVVHFGLCIKSS